MSHALVAGTTGVSLELLRDVQDLLHQRVGEVGRGRTEEWEISYMRLVAAAYGAIATVGVAGVARTVRSGGVGLVGSACEGVVEDGERVECRFGGGGGVVCVGGTVDGVGRSGLSVGADDVFGSRDGEALVAGDGSSCDGSARVGGTQACLTPRGSNYKRNARNRENKKKKRALELDEAWVEKKKLENELAIVKIRKDIEYQKGRDVAKEIAKTEAILDGQISGKFSPFASQRVTGWAKTVRSGGSGSLGSTSRSKWSGTGASSKTDLSVLEEKVAKLEQKGARLEARNLELLQESKEFRKKYEDAEAMSKHRKTVVDNLLKKKADREYYLDSYQDYSR